MFKNLFDKFDDIDMQKVVEVVNLVWNNREKIMDLIENLPALLQDTGKSIESAGESAMKASLFLAGAQKGAGKDAPSAGELSVLAATALDRCYKEISAAAKIMEGLGQELDDVRIPSVRPKYIELMGSKVIGGLEIGEEGLLDKAATRVKSGSARLHEIGNDLQAVSKNMRDLGGVLTDAGKDLNNVGVQLKQSGGKLRSLTDSFKVQEK